MLGKPKGGSSHGLGVEATGAYGHGHKAYMYMVDLHMCMGAYECMCLRGWEWSENLIHIHGCNGA